ncbi:MAG: hypothetical protein KC547_07005, partial [Anaerolineae bacterium]|nr:hypothetical protein [Anaerolineae bacterium]
GDNAPHRGSTWRNWRRIDQGLRCTQDYVIYVFTTKRKILFNAELFCIFTRSDKNLAVGLHSLYCRLDRALGLVGGSAAVGIVSGLSVDITNIGTLWSLCK